MLKHLVLKDLQERWFSEIKNKRGIINDCLSATIVLLLTLSVLARLLFSAARRIWNMVKSIIDSYITC